MVEIHPSARKHGIADEDIEHAVTHAMAIDDIDDDARLYIGPAQRRPARGADDPHRRRFRARDPRHAHAPEVPTAALGALMAPKKKSYGTTRSGRTVDDDLVDELAAQAECGYDVDEILRRRGGRPPIGTGPATVESVRLDPELRRALAERAERDQESTSAVIRKALRNYLKAS